MYLLFYPITIGHGVVYTLSHPILTGLRAAVHSHFHQQLYRWRTGSPLGFILARLGTGEPER